MWPLSSPTVDIAYQQFHNKMPLLHIHDNITCVSVEGCRGDLACFTVLCSEVLISETTRTTPTLNSRRRLYIGLKAIHVNGTLFFTLLQVSRRDRRHLPLWCRSNALFQLHESCHIGRNELVFGPWGRGLVVAVVVVTVHQRWVGCRGFGLTNQRHLRAKRAIAREAGKRIMGRWGLRMKIKGRKWCQGENKELRRM